MVAEHLVVGSWRSLRFNLGVYDSCSHHVRFDFSLSYLHPLDRLAHTEKVVWTTACQTRAPGRIAYAATRCACVRVLTVWW